MVSMDTRLQVVSAKTLNIFGEDEMSLPGISEQLIEVNREIHYREMVLESAKRCGSAWLPTIVQARQEISDLSVLRANLEAIQGRVK